VRVRRRGERAVRAHPLAVDDDKLAGLDLALELRADQVQAQVSDAMTTVSSRRPSTSGRKPCGSRTASSWSSERMSSE